MIRPLLCLIITLPAARVIRNTPAQIRVDHLVPVVVLHPDQELIARDPGVVDEHVDAPEALPGRLDQAIDVLALRRRPPAPPAPPRPAPPAPSPPRRDAPRRGQRLPRRRRPLPATGRWRDRCRASPPVTIATLPARPLPRSRRRRPASAAIAFSSEAGSSTAWPRAPSSVRLSRPVSTRPGPTSRNPVRPRAPALHALGPAHRARHLLDQERLHLVRGPGDPAVHVARPPGCAAR